MTNEELTAIEARANAATMGPWKGTKNSGVVSTRTRDSVFETGCGCCTEKFLSAEDAAFIADARADVPALVAEVRRLRTLVERAFQEGQDGRILDGHEQFIYDVAWEHSDAFKALEGEG